MSSPEKETLWKSRASPSTSLAPKSKATASVAVACNVAGMGVAALFYSRVWDRGASHVIVWIMALIVSLTVGAMIAGVLLRFTKSPFWKSWMKISWVALALMVFSAWNK